MSISTALEARSETGAGLLAKLAAVARRACTALVAWRMERRALAALHGMSDRELRDIGLVRSEITGAVCRGRTGGRD